MIYLTREDLLQNIEAQTLTDLEQGNTTALDNAEAAALELAASYLQSGGYDAPAIWALTGPDRPAILLGWLADLIIYNLHKTQNAYDFPEFRADAREQAEKMLERVRLGKLKFQWPRLPIEPAQTSQIRAGSLIPLRSTHP